MEFLHEHDFFKILIHLLAAIVAGGIIGLERSYHGRPAGFRTHTLVCLASSLLMLVTMYQWQWLPPGTSMDTVRTDPTRMAQGIMTGIGFLVPAVLSTILTLGTLSVFRWFERRLPSHYYAHQTISFDRDNVMTEDEVIKFMANNGFDVVNFSYRTVEESTAFEYKMVVCTTNQKNLSKLATALRQLPMVRNFSISPTGD